jgi:hypothetical protein
MPAEVGVQELPEQGVQETSDALETESPVAGGEQVPDVEVPVTVVTPLCRDTSQSLSTRLLPSNAGSNITPPPNQKIVTQSSQVLHNVTPSMVHQLLLGDDTQSITATQDEDVAQTNGPKSLESFSPNNSLPNEGITTNVAPNLLESITTRVTLQLFQGDNQIIAPLQNTQTTAPKLIEDFSPSVTLANACRSPKSNFHSTTPLQNEDSTQTNAPTLMESISLSIPLQLFQVDNHSNTPLQNEDISQTTTPKLIEDVPPSVTLANAHQSPKSNFHSITPLQLFQVDNQSATPLQNENIEQHIGPNLLESITSSIPCQLLQSDTPRSDQSDALSIALLQNEGITPAIAPKMHESITPSITCQLFQVDNQSITPLQNENIDQPIAPKLSITSSIPCQLIQGDTPRSNQCDTQSIALLQTEDISKTIAPKLNESITPSVTCQLFQDNNQVPHSQHFIFCVTYEWAQ